MESHISRQTGTLTLTSEWTCPFVNCTQHKDADKPSGFVNTASLRRHLTDAHSHELDKIPLSFLQQSNTFICHQCKTAKLFTTSSSLDSHVKESHTPTRSSTNHQIITKYLYDESTEACQLNHWEHALEWLANHNHEPPPYRSTLLKCIKYQLEDALTDLLHDIVKATNEMKKAPPSNKRLLPEYNPDVAAGQLVYLYEQLILAPTTKERNGPSLNQLIKRRIRLFRSGQLQTLYEDSRTVKSKHPHNSSSTNITFQQQAAQRAADNDDFKKATSYLLKATPIAPNTPENIEICQGLHPDKLEYTPNLPKTRAQSYTPPISFKPDEVVSCIRKLPKGKAIGIQGDSLDMFAKLVKKKIPHQCKTAATSPVAKDLATFFSNIANAKIGNIERNHINTIYFVAFHKDVNNPKKLRPIGVPSAIRRITANLLITKNKPDFASHLLPFNYAIGVQGGISTVVHTMRLGVEKYISNPQAEGKLPTRALVSLDIKNMFNAVSRHKLREIMAYEFPHLLPFTDKLYEHHHTAKFKDDSDTWQHFKVEEGFTQGCPLSPLFAGIVLTHILQQINKELMERAEHRCKSGNPLDDGMGGSPLIMAYVDDTNCLLPIEDVHYFLQRFKEIGIPLGAEMNTDKTRIMTTISGQSILPTLIDSNLSIGLDLQQAITEYSTKNGEMYEETKGLRILGSPIGSIDFQKSFITDYMSKIKADTSKLLAGLEDDQTILQLYRQCTSQRLNHLFPSDIYAHEAETECEGGMWQFWDSKTTRDFDNNNQHIIKAITNKTHLAYHSKILMNIGTKMGGIGINTPRNRAIPASILATKGTLNTIYNGVYLSKHRERVMLPDSITSLYKDRENNPSTTFQIFNKYAPAIAQICTGDGSPAGITRFISNTSMNKCHEKINTEISLSLQDYLRQENALPPDSRHNLAEILDGKLGQGLMDLPRHESTNRQNNRLFRFNLLRCLRMDIWETKEQLKCPHCKQNFDTKGDHLYQCSVIGKHTKTKMHNNWRDMWYKQMQKLMPLLNLTDTKIQREALGLVRRIKNSTIRPFDTHFNFPQVSMESFFRSTLSKLGFDMVTCNSDTCPSPTRGGSDAKSNDITTSLISAERSKFQRGNGTQSSRTDKTSQITLTGEQIIGELYKSNMQLIPFAVSPLGLFGPTIEHFLYGIEPHIEHDKLHTIDKRLFPNAHKMASQAFSTKTPSNILQRADQIWNSKQNKYNYGGSYKSPDPSTYYTQMFGREVCFANGAAGLTALDLLYENNRGGPQQAHPNNTQNTTVNEDQISYLLNNADDRATSNSQRWCSQSTNESESSPSSFCIDNSTT